MRDRESESEGRRVKTRLVLFKPVCSQTCPSVRLIKLIRFFLWAVLSAGVQPSGGCLACRRVICRGAGVHQSTAPGDPVRTGSE